MANVTAPSQPTLTALRTEELNYLLGRANAHFGTALTIADLFNVIYDALGILVAQADAIVNARTYHMWRGGDQVFYLYRLEADGSQTLIAQL